MKAGLRVHFLLPEMIRINKGSGEEWLQNKDNDIPRPPRAVELLHNGVQGPA